MTDPAPEVFGPYLVYERLGSGGMATVHRAVKTGIEGFQRPVALKRLLSQYAGDQEFVKSFIREARLAARLQHANIAQTYDLGRVEQSYYIAMELIEGVDLRHVLAHIAYSVGPMPVPLILSLMIQVCDALDYAHSFADETGRPLGIVHRDVSPSNVIVGRDGVVKIIDFGIAKASSATLFTASGTLKGKFSYMAPESLEGRTDARSDLFAVGALLYELLTARPLFKGASDFDTLDRIKKLHPPPASTLNPQIPPEVDQIAATALAKDPARRWQTAAALRNAMTSIASQPALRATHLDVPRWIDWALAQPTRRQAWDEALPEEPSIEIHVNAPTVIGAAPAPLRSVPVPVPVPAPVTETPPSRSGTLAVLLILLLCAAAAVAGFFLVDAFF
jgi:serine/threonine protein kinase